ncbi:glycosyltransferase family 2 protein [Ottowia beijingensis]|uniref:glycosyltransferase family 2 protein n=1 Tax=Ottowia beijingensis TaxID=1207057 RepID=UPI002FDA256E
MRDLSLIIPVYRNEASLPDLLAALRDLDRQLGDRLEVVFVVDGSPDRCFEILRERLPVQPFSATLVLLSRNFGSFAAVRAGLAQATGRFFAVMAADLQEPPELVEQMFAALQSQPVDVVVGVRSARDDPALQRWQANLFWAAYRRWVVPEMPPGGVDVFACNQAFRAALLALEERRSSLIAQLFWLGFRRIELPYERRARAHGESAWTWRKKLSYLADSVFAFTDLPIRALLLAGSAGVLVASVVGLLAVFGRLMGWIVVPGYAMTMVAILFFGALNLLSLGIVGSYAWRAYENTKQRPQALVLSVQRFVDQGGRSDD